MNNRERIKINDSELFWNYYLQFYVVQDLATRGSCELLSDFLGKYFKFLFKQKL